MSDFLLSLKDVSLAFGGPQVLDKVSLSIHKGLRAALTGRNGEGKSTLLKVIAGSLEPDAGEIVRAPGLKVVYVGQGVEDLGIDKIDRRIGVDIVLSILSVSAPIPLSILSTPKSSTPCPTYTTFSPGALTISPASGSSVPAMTFINVDFPSPLRPVKAALSPLWIESETLSRTCGPPKARETSFKERRKSLTGGLGLRFKVQGSRFKTL